MKSTCNISADWQQGRCGLQSKCQALSASHRISQAYSARQNCLWSLTHPHTIRTDGPTQIPFQTCADYFCIGQCVQLVKYLVPLSLKQGSPTQNLQQTRSGTCYPKECVRWAAMVGEGRLTSPQCLNSKTGIFFSNIENTIIQQTIYLQCQERGL